MDLSNTFEVPRSVEQTWPLLLDVARIAPCLPGAELREIVDEEYRGVVKVKIGPVVAQYKGAATFLEQDHENHRVVINGKGRDTRGAGSAEAVITATLGAVDASTTRVSVDTELQIKGKVAQFGRGMMAEVSAKLMDEFAENLSAMIAADNARPRDPGDEAPGEPPEPGEPASPAAAESVDLLRAAAAPLVKRVVVAVLVLLILRSLARRYRRPIERDTDRT